MFSYQWSGVLQIGQCEAGKAIDSPSLGSLRITTFKKLPTTAPKSAAIAASNVCGIIIKEKILKVDYYFQSYIL